MTSFLKTAAIAVLGLFGLCSSYATTLNLNSLSDGALSAWDNKGSFYYKFEGTYDEEGAGAGFLEGSFLNGGMTARVTWDSALFTPDFDFILIKSSQQVLTWDVQAIDWSKYDAFEVTNTGIMNTNAGLQQISHLTINGTVHEVPDSGATVVLLGLGLTMLGFSRRLVAGR